jgi:hypothetical protein
VPVTFKLDGDWDGFDRVIAAIEGLESATVATGVQDEAHEGPRASKAGLSTGDLMMINEFGDGNIPARPIFTPAMDENQEKYFAMQAQVFAAYRRKGGSIAKLRAGLAAIGKEMVQDIQAVVQAQEFEPLHPKTIERKGHDFAWLETGQLLKSIDYFIDVEALPERGKSGTAFFRGKLGRFAKVNK